MARGVRLYLVGSAVLVTLAGCGRSWFEQREPWRTEAEVACMKSGTVKESPAKVRIDPIAGPGACGADFPLRVSALGENSTALGYTAELRPPAAIPNASPAQPRWPISEPRPQYVPPPGDVRTTPLGAPNAPMPISPPGLSPPDSSEDDQFARDAPPSYQVRRYPPQDAAAPTYSDRAPITSAPYPPPAANDEIESSPYPARDGAYPRGGYEPPGASRPYHPPPDPPRLGPARRPQVSRAVGPATVIPAATLACPLVSALDQWIDTAVQPAALRWFGQPVAEIKQISAYSCRGMNGQPGARISEHAFGNALDIASFTLADGRRVTVKDGWRGRPEEQGFLRDVQAAACQHFSTVLAPGSNAFHYDHIHVDLMRRSSGRAICQPDAVPGDMVAARAAQRGVARGRDPSVTGSIGNRRSTTARSFSDEDDWIEDEPVLIDK
jgi:hypothetical protein